MSQLPKNISQWAHKWVQHKALCLPGASGLWSFSLLLIVLLLLSSLLITREGGGVFTWDGIFLLKWRIYLYLIRIDRIWFFLPDGGYPAGLSAIPCPNWRISGPTLIFIFWLEPEILVNVKGFRLIDYLIKPSFCQLSLLLIFHILCPYIYYHGLTNWNKVRGGWWHSLQSLSKDKKKGLTRTSLIENTSFMQSWRGEKYR